MRKPITKYNPSFLSDEALIDSFVVRHADLHLILETVRENCGPSNQHVLVIGPRGIGKTTLVRRVAAEVRREPALGERWYPLAYGEEGYEITSPGEFWLESLFHLARQTGDARWRETYDDLKLHEPVEERLRERALAHLMDFADQQNKRILLIAENLNRLFTDQMGNDHAWTLRHTLLNEPRIMLLGSATTRFAQIERAGRAMYDLFRVHDLDPLNTDECRAVWAAITGETLEGDRIRPIEILTGGSPRLLTIFSSFAAGRSLRELMEQLVELVDDHTEYFKSHLDGLPPTERKAFVALADIWDPATARQVGQATRLNVNKASALLRRLAGRGLVLVRSGGGRAKRYQVAERLYNIYYLLRRHGAPSVRVRAVVRFMVEFYEPDQLVRALVEIAKEACDMAPDARADHLAAYLGSLGEVDASKLRGKVLFETPSAFWELPGALSSILGLLASTPGTEAGVGEEQAILGRMVVDKLLPSLVDAIKAPQESRQEAQTKLSRASAGMVEAAKQIVQALPDSATGWTALGVFSMLAGSYHEAEPALIRAWKLEPHNTSVFLTLTELWRMQLTELVIAAAAARGPRDVLDRIEAHSASWIPDPLVAGLRLSLGEEVVVAQEVLEVGKDVARRIEERREQMLKAEALGGADDEESGQGEAR